MTQPNNLKSHFLLDPEIVFLNHGSFGACPKPVFAAYQAWQLELERQPVAFLGRRIDGLLSEARTALAAYVNSDPDDVVFVANATAGVNTIAKAIPLHAGDEILTTDHEYGACMTTWGRVAAPAGAVIVERKVTLPLLSDEAFVEEFWAGVTPKTRVVYLSHITSPTALTFPVAEICRRARAAGIISVIDGAHAPGQIRVDMREVDPDFYTGNCHKWMCAPKGSGFLYVRRDQQDDVHPLIISWGYRDGDTFISRHQVQPTRDPAAFLTVPAAIQFQREHEWDAVRQQCHAVAVDLRNAINAWSGLQPLCSDDHFAQMFTVEVPPCDPVAVKDRLYDDYKIELPMFNWQGKPCLRTSIQGYNTAHDGEFLLNALREVFAKA